MRRFHRTPVSALLLATGLLLHGANALATGSATGSLNVSATLTNACAFSGSPSLGFGSFAGLIGTGDQTASQSIGLACTTGTSPTLQVASATVLTGTTTPSNTIPYTLSMGTGGSAVTIGTTAVAIPGYTPTGDVVNFTINGRIAASDFGAMPADTYTQSVTLQVNY